MEYQNAVSERQLETARCTYNTENLSRASSNGRSTNGVSVQSMSPAAFSTTQDPTSKVRCGSPTPLPFYGATRPLIRQRSPTTPEPRMPVPTMSASSLFHMRERPARE